MPDRDAILKGLRELPLISPRGIEGAIPPEQGHAWIGNEYDAEFGVTKEAIKPQEAYILRTRGDMRARALIERDFATHLGPPNYRSSEVGYPVVDSSIWRISRVRHLLSNTSQ